MKLKPKFYVVLIILTVLMLTACEQPADTGKAEPVTLEKDIGISVNGNWYPIYADVVPLLTALGNDYEYEYADGCVYKGQDKTFVYENCMVQTNPNGDYGDLDIWYVITLFDSSMQTARGIKVGDTLEKVYSTYGDRYYWQGDVLVYSVSGVDYEISRKIDDFISPNIQFTVEDNIVTLIEIYYPTNQVDGESI